MQAQPIALSRLHHIAALALFSALVLARPALAEPNPNIPPHAPEQAQPDPGSLDRLITQIQGGAQKVVRGTSDVVVTAMGLLGVRYRYGGSSPDNGLDCSGLVRLVFKETFGMLLPHRAAEIGQMGEKVGKEQLQPGDLVFFNTLRRSFSHVGIYVGEGRFLHAPSKGGEVRVEEMNTPYWSKRFNGARRISPEEQQAIAKAQAADASTSASAQ